MTVVSFRAAWRWAIFWLAFDVGSFVFQSSLPSWWIKGDPSRDFHIICFIVGLWIFERRKESQP